MNNKTHFIVGTIWYYLAIVLSCLLIENFGMFSYRPLDGIGDNAFFLLAGFILVVSVFYIKKVELNRKKGFDAILFYILFISGILFSISILKQTSQTLINNDGEEPYIYEIVFTKMEKIRALISLWIGLLAVYGVTFIISRITLRNRSLSWIYLVLIAIGIISTAGSLFTDFDAYKNILSGSNSAVGVKFLYFNENYYGFFTMISILSCIAYIYYNSKWYINLCLVILCIELFFTSCASALYPTAIMVFVYVIYRLIVGLKKQPIRYSIYWGIFIFTIASLSVGYALYAEVEGTWMFNIHKYLSGNVFNKDMKTFTNRTTIWNTAINIIKEDTWGMLFGHGLKTSSKILEGHMMVNSRGATPIHSCHSSYIEILLRYGFVGFGLYSLAILYIFYCLCYFLIKKQFRFVVNYGICLVVLLVFSGFESYPLFTSNFSGMFLTLAFAMPIIRAYKVNKHKEMEEEIVKAKVDDKPNSYLLNFQISNFILSVALVAALAFIPRQGKSNPEIKSLLSSVLAISLIANLFVPYIVMLWHRQTSNFVKRIIINSAIYILGVGILVIAKFYVSSFAPYFYPTLIVASLGFFFFEMLFYSFLFDGKFKEWISLSVTSFFKMSLIPALITTIIGVSMLLTFDTHINDYLCFDLCLVILLFIYFAVFSLLPLSLNIAAKNQIDNCFLRKETKLFEKDAI